MRRNEPLISMLKNSFLSRRKGTVPMSPVLFLDNNLLQQTQKLFFKKCTETMSGSVLAHYLPLALPRLASWHYRLLMSQRPRQLNTD